MNNNSGNKIGGKRIGSIVSTKETSGVEGTEAVSDITAVKAAASVKAVKGSTAIANRKRNATRTMTQEEREKLFKMIEEEAESLFSEGKLPLQQKEIVKSAVLMAVDSGILIEEKKEEK
jgi:hypothetical protein